MIAKWISKCIFFTKSFTFWCTNAFINQYTTHKHTQNIHVWTCLAVFQPSHTEFCQIGKAFKKKTLLSHWDIRCPRLRLHQSGSWREISREARIHLSLTSGARSVRSMCFTWHILQIHIHTIRTKNCKIISWWNCTLLLFF